MKQWLCVLAFLAFPVLALAADARPDWLYSRPDAVQPPAAPQAGGGGGGGGGGQPAAVPAGVPAVVAQGRLPEVRPCNTCHVPSGSGQPESANLRGLPAPYFEHTMKDFQDGGRKGDRASSMIQIAKGMTDAELKEAAAYYAALKPFPWSKVVEADTIPKSYVSPTGSRRPWPEGGTEMIGSRIVEFAEDQAKIRAPNSQLAFTAFVPRGSIAKGEALVKTGGGGKTIACGLCHGEDLRGVGEIPGIAGRSPLFIARQLSEFQSGDRSGPNAVPMTNAVGKLQLDDLIAIGAYVGSRDPS